MVRPAGLALGGPALVAALAAAAAPHAPHASITRFSGELQSVSAASPSDAWATGFSGDNKVLMAHWNGTAWARVSIPLTGFPSLNSVSADSASDAWAVGQTCGSACNSVKDLALRWNGTNWANVAIPSPGKPPVVDDLYSVSAAAPNDVWAVGFFGHSGGGNLSALALHWNGTAWAQVPVPNAAHVELLAVTAKSPNDVWAVGDDLSTFDALILHWNGTAWTQAAIPAITGSLKAVTELSPGNVWAVGLGGFTSGTSLVLHWDGTSWTRQASPSPGGTGVSDFSRLLGVSALSATNAWAVGEYGHETAMFQVGKPLVLHWDGTNWTQTASPFFGSASGLDSVQALSPANAWATGGVFQRNAAGNTVILHWDGTAWTRS
jgi:hypothetical protein